MSSGAPNRSEPAPARDDATEITRLLEAAADGSEKAINDLLPAVYGALRRLAQRDLNRLPAGQTLTATAIVHEAYVRLVGPDDRNARRWQSRLHFFNAAAQAMRNILVDQARRKAARKRGGDALRTPLHDDMPDDAISPATTVTRREEILHVDAALDRLRSEHPRQGSVFTLHYFAGLPQAQIAELLDVTTRTVERDWRFARAWLRDTVRSEAGRSDHE